MSGENKEKQAALRYAPETFIREVQKTIAPNPYMSEDEIILTAQGILFEHDIALGLEDTRRLNGLAPTDYTSKEIDEINEALIALGGTQNLIDILKGTDPSDVKPLMDGRKQFEKQLERNGIRYSTSKDGSYQLDCGRATFDTGGIEFFSKKYPREKSDGNYLSAYIDIKNPKRTSELVQQIVQNIAKFRNKQVEKKISKNRQQGEIER